MAYTIEPFFESIREVLSARDEELTDVRRAWHEQADMLAAAETRSEVRTVVWLNGATPSLWLFPYASYRR